MKKRPVVGRAVTWATCAATVILAWPAIAVVIGRDDATSGAVRIKTLSTAASRVTGGDVLMEIELPGNRPAASVKIAVGGRDVSDAFHPGAAPQTLVGLVTGLSNGKSTITVAGTGKGAPDASLEITNYPITGPVFSGPWTAAVHLPDRRVRAAGRHDARAAARRELLGEDRRAVRLSHRRRPPSRDVQAAARARASASRRRRENDDDRDRRDRELHRPRRDRHDESRHLSERDSASIRRSDPPPTPFSPPKGWNRRLHRACTASAARAAGTSRAARMGVNPLDARAARRGLRALHQHAQPSDQQLQRRSSPARRR